MGFPKTVGMQKSRKSRIKIGIIGLGYTGKKHFSTFFKSDRCEVCFICKRNFSTFQDSSEYDGTERYTDFQEAISDGGADAVCVCTPDSSHYPIAKYALEHGLDVFVEKPLAEHRAQAKELCELAEKKGRILMVGHTEVYDRHINELIRLASSRQVKMIESVRAGGDFSPRDNLEPNLCAMERSLYDRLIHQCGVVDALAGTEAKKIISYEKELSCRKHKIFSTVLFENDVLADIKTLTIADAGLLKKISVKGAGFSINYSLRRGKARLVMQENGKKTEIQPRLDADDFSNAGLAFVDAVENLRKPISDGRSGLRTMQTAQGIVRQHDVDMERLKGFMASNNVYSYINYVRSFFGLEPQFLKLISTTDPGCFLHSKSFLLFRQLGFLISKSDKEVIDQIMKDPSEKRISEEYHKRLSDGSDLVRIGLECNQSCLFCNISDADRVQKKSEIRKKLDESVKKNYQVIFSGGEPTIDKDMLKIARYASSIGFTELNIQTNATVCSDIDYAIELVLAGVNFALVSLHSDKADISDGLTRVPGSFEKTLLGIRNLLDLGVDVTLAHVINTKNHERLCSFVEFVSSRFPEIWKIDLLFNAFRGRGAGHPELLPKLSDAAGNIEKGYAKATELGISLRNAFSLPLCYFSFGLEDSYEYVTLKKIKEQGREMPENLKIVAREKHKSIDCQKCIYNDYCLGIWKSYAKHHSDSELRPFSDAFLAPEYGFSGCYLIEHENKHPAKIMRGIRQGKYRPSEKDNASEAKGYVGPNVLIFKNIMNCKDKEDVDWFYQGSLYLLSALTAEDIPVRVTDSKISLEDGETITDKKGFLKDLSDDVNIVVISLSEFYIKKAASLIRLIRKNSDAYVAVGGIMPTNTPEHVAVHLPDADFIVRGAGERILPRIVKILSGKMRSDGLSADQKTSLLGLKGLIANIPGCFISAESNMINYLDNLDETRLDFSVLSEKNVTEGLNLSTSRGCFNNCLFCTTVGRGRFRAMSYPGLIRLLADYKQRLTEIFGDVENIPKSAYKLSFNDDDFLGDKERAVEFFSYIRRSEFCINFIQTAIRSFYVRGTLASDVPKLDMELMERLGPDIFHPESDHNIYIGTENLSDDEILRLNKGYSYRYVKMVVHELSKRRIKQGHHLIFCNPDTKISDIFGNLIKITRLCVRYKGYFRILLPIIQSQVSLFGSASYKKYKDHVKTGEVLIAEGFSEYDYPLVLRDIPKDRIVHMLSEKTEEIFSGEKYYLDCWRKSLFFLLESAERLSLSEDPLDQELASKMYFVVDSYSDYPKKVFPEDRIRRKAFLLERNNLEIMLSRKCQLRCRYCPVDKNDCDISLEDLKRSIDLLMKSDSDRVRVDFLGGEPLLRFDLVKAGIEYAEKLAKKHSKKVSYFMITNTIALDSDVLDYIKKHDFLLELSLDGDEKTHNEFKIPVNKSINPYRTMTSKFKGILASGIKNYVIMVATPKTVGRLSANFRHIRSFGFSNIHINYAFGVEWEEEELEVFFSELERIRKEYSEELSSGRIHLGNLETRVEPAIINSELMVDWDGSIHLMTEWIFENSKVNDRDLNVGHISRIGSFSDLYFDDFMSYWVLSKKYTRENVGMKKIILNNMDVGRRCKELFSRWKTELGIESKNMKMDDLKKREKKRKRG